MRLKTLLAPVAVAAALGVAACGGDDGAGGADARELLDQAFSQPIESGKLDLGLGFELEGSSQLDGPVKVSVSGPFQDNGDTKVPSMDLDLSFTGAGQNLAAGAVVTPENAWISFQGQDYEVGEELFGEFASEYGKQRSAGGDRSLKALGIDATRWLEQPEVAGEEDVAGAETTKITGDVDLARVIDDLGKASDKMGGGVPGVETPELTDEQKRQLAEFVEKATVEVYVANDDKTLRRLVLDVEFQVPEAQRAEVGGASGGSAELDLTLAEVGEKQEIEPPADAKPLDELLGRFGFGAESLLQ